MYCHKCGAELPDIAQYCPKCGVKTLIQPSVSPIRSRDSNAVNVHPHPTRLPKNSNTTNEGALHLIEGVLSALLAVAILLVPTVSINYYFGETELSILDLLLNYSTYSDLFGQYSIVVPVLGIWMAFNCVCETLNAVQAFSNKAPKTIVRKGITFSSSTSGGATRYALVLIILLTMLSKFLHGAIGASKWTWVLLLGGIACQIVHHVRCSPKATDDGARPLRQSY